MLDLVALGYELHEPTMTSSKSKLRIFANNARASRKNSYLFYIILVLGYIWPVLPLEQPSVLTIAISQEQLTFDSESRALKKNDIETPEDGGSKHAPSSRAKTKKGSSDLDKSGMTSEESNRKHDDTPKGPGEPPEGDASRGSTEMGAVESTPTDPLIESPVESTPTDPPIESPVESTPTDPPIESPVESMPTDPPIESPVESMPTDPPIESPVKSKPTDSPTAPPVEPKATKPPTAPPVKSKPTDSPTAPPVEPKATKPPTAPPVKSKPTDSPTAPPVEPKATKPPTAPPVKSKPPTDSPTKAPLDDGGACTPARTCTECKDLAASLATEDGSTKTCVWKDGSCQLGDKAGAAPILCDNDPPTDNSEDSLFLNRPGQAVFGGLVVLVFVCILLRRYMKRSTTARVGNTVNYGKYQGVYVYWFGFLVIIVFAFCPLTLDSVCQFRNLAFSNTVSEDEDEEWGWDDDKPKQRNTLEMTHMGSGSRSMSHGSGNTPRHRRSVSPQLENTVAAPVERKGFAVRKTGMNNPLHHPLPAKATFASVVPKTAVVPPPARKILPPSTDDFFAEMGVAPQPKFPSSSAKPMTKRLPAAVMRLESDDALETTDGGNWGDDADLDDLLDS
jgi:hypothetical protein